MYRLHVVTKVLMFCAFKIAQLVVLSFQMVLVAADAIFGTEKELTYERSAQVFDIWGRCKLHPIISTSKYDFLLTHKERVSPSYVLQPTVSLYHVTKYEAVFIETPSDVDVFRSEHSPWLQIAQYRKATRIIVLPVSALLRLAASLPEPQTPVLVISSAGRCGSSLLAQMLEQIPGTQTHSEPAAMSDLQWIKPALEPEAYREYYRGCCKIIFRSKPGVNRYCVKTRTYCNSQIQLLWEFLPNSKLIFLYRSPVPFVLSFVKMLDSVIENAGSFTRLIHCVVMNKTLRKIVPICPRLLRYWLYGDEPSEPFSGQQDLMFSLMPWRQLSALAFMFYAHSARQYILARDRGIPIMGVTYEDLTYEFDSYTRRILQHCDIEAKYVHLALRATQRDSQENSEYSRSKLREREDVELSEELLGIGNTIMSVYGLPDITSDTLLSHTLRI